MSRIFLPKDASRAALRQAQQARRNRAEIVRELSWGRVSRRELIKMGIFTGAGMLAPIGGLNPFVANAKAQTLLGPTGAPPSPLFGCQKFTAPMPRFDVVPRNPISCLSPAPVAQVNEADRIPVDPALGGGTGPREGRPPGPVWAHQRFSEFAPQIAVEMTQASGCANYVY